MNFFDMHCHLDFAPNAASVVAELDTLGVGAFAVSVLPSGLDVGISGSEEKFPMSKAKWTSRGTTGNFSSDPEIPTDSLVRFGVGLHPWWVAAGRAGEEEIRAATDAIATNRFVGEVGLDFGKTHGQHREAQTAAFQAIAQTCAAHGGRTLSIHAVHAAGEALDILEASGALNTCTCIFHWFSDSGVAFTRAVRSGCLFSVGKLMLRSARGREYARQIPLAQLLLETDEPGQGQPYEVSVMQAQLAETAAHIAALKGVHAEELAATIAATSKRVLTA